MATAITSSWQNVQLAQPCPQPNLTGMKAESPAQSDAAHQPSTPRPDATIQETPFPPATPDKCDECSPRTASDASDSSCSGSPPAEVEDTAAQPESQPALSAPAESCIAKVTQRAAEQTQSTLSTPTCSRSGSRRGSRLAAACEQLAACMLSSPAATGIVMPAYRKPSESETSSHSKDADEPLLIENPSRYSMFPIKYSDIWLMYKQAVASFWTPEEVDLTSDMADWQRLTASEQHFVKQVLAFFAASDGIVMENLAVRFMHEVQFPEARAFYGFQIAIENVHSEMYSLLLEEYVKDPIERSGLFDAIHTVPCIAKKAQWAMKWITSDCSFAQRLLAFACVEGIHFSGSFCAIFWLKKRLLMPGLSFSNVLISRDEGLHTDFACLLYRQYVAHKLPYETVIQIIKEAVDLEVEFCCDALSVGLIGMNAGLMSTYIKFVADRLLVALGYERHYHARNPFDWMEMISLEGKANFFERRVGEYQLAGVLSAGKQGGRRANDYVFTTDEDF